MYKILAAVLLSAALPVQALSLWEAGRLDYADGNAEVAAFVNGPQNTQLQVVLCSKNEAVKYRFSLLLPQFFEQGMMLEAEIDCDGRQSSAYVELSGNSLEFTVDDELYLSLKESPNLTITFEPADAAFLQLPPVIDLPLMGADQVIRRVASECTALTVHDGFLSRPGLLSAILWPRNGFNPDDIGDIDSLCTRAEPRGYFFDLNDACRLALDRFYQREGEGPLTFLYQLFHDPDGPYQKYKTLWNDALHAMPAGALAERGEADGREWYLGLYTLAGSRNVLDLPQSYYALLKHPQDPTTLLYDIDNRYEMEQLKYVSVLLRRMQGSYQGLQRVEQALNAWSEFYRRLSYLQPYTLQALALRPMVYREMLMRIWRVAGRPRGIVLSPEHVFRQGSGGRTVTNDELERKCAYFEGMRGDEFFYGSNECVNAIRAEMHLLGMMSEHYSAVRDAWDDFAKAWRSSIFASDDASDAVGENLRSNLALTLLTTGRIYGFGDYFLLRECISSRDGDICAFEKERALSSLSHELNNKVNSIARVSRADAALLQELQGKWQRYQDALTLYTEDLAATGRIPYWRSSLVQAVSAVLQTDAVMSAPYYREELPDASLYSNDEDDFGMEFSEEFDDLQKSALDEAKQRAEEREQEEQNAQPAAEQPKPQDSAAKAPEQQQQR